MNIEELRDYCLTKPGAVESFPFGDETLVFKVANKMFSLTTITAGNRFNAKCDPERAVELREQFGEIQPGFHMNKTHWNTIYIDGTLSYKQIYELVDHSYNLVVNSLPKKLRDEIIAGQQ